MYFVYFLVSQISQWYSTRYQFPVSVLLGQTYFNPVCLEQYVELSSELLTISFATNWANETSFVNAV